MKLLLVACLSIGIALPLGAQTDAVAAAAAGSAAESAAIPDFGGLWSTTFGTLRLVQSGTSVEGLYELAGGSTIEGAVRGDVLHFLYREPGAGGRDVEGQGTFTLDATGRAFAGTWSERGSDDLGEWTGTRLDEEPGVRWLVILEAPWEESLRESEYAFADMLAEYFTMAPARHVRVRRRAFHDGADLVRWCREITFLPGRVVLVLSTHGSAAGVQVGGETIGPEAIADALAGAGNLDLLHLSGCAMMSGDVPQRIAERMPSASRFPISGYRTVVDWDASAIADFVFLSLVLVRGLPPADAVRAAHASAPFTGASADAVPKGGFAPLGLDVFVPEGVPARDG